MPSVRIPAPQVAARLAAAVEAAALRTVMGVVCALVKGPVTFELAQSRVLGASRRFGGALL